MVSCQLLLTTAVAALIYSNRSVQAFFVGNLAVQVGTSGQAGGTRSADTPAGACSKHGDAVTALLRVPTHSCIVRLLPSPLHQILLLLATFLLLIPLYLYKNRHPTNLWLLGAWTLVMRRVCVGWLGGEGGGPACGAALGRPSPLCPPHSPAA